MLKRTLNCFNELVPLKAGKNVLLSIFATMTYMSLIFIFSVICSFIQPAQEQKMATFQRLGIDFGIAANSLNSQLQQVVMF